VEGNAGIKMSSKDNIEDGYTFEEGDLPQEVWVDGLYKVSFPQTLIIIVMLLLIQRVWILWLNILQEMIMILVIQSFKIGEVGKIRTSYYNLLGPLIRKLVISTFFIFKYII